MNDIKGKTETTSEGAEMREKFRLEAIAIIERLSLIHISEPTRPY